MLALYPRHAGIPQERRRASRHLLRRRAGSIRSGRWWEVGSTAFEGARIKEWRPHWSILHKSHAEDAALYGSEAEKWKHNPILHPDQVFSSFALFWNHRKELPSTTGNTQIYPYILITCALS